MTTIRSPLTRIVHISVPGIKARSIFLLSVFAVPSTSLSFFIGQTSEQVVFLNNIIAAVPKSSARLSRPDAMSFYKAIHRSNGIAILILVWLGVVVVHIVCVTLVVALAPLPSRLDVGCVVLYQSSLQGCTLKSRISRTNLYSATALCLVSYPTWESCLGRCCF